MVVCGGLWWFAVVCGGLRWCVIVCGGLSYSHTPAIWGVPWMAILLNLDILNYFPNFRTHHGGIYKMHKFKANSTVSI